MSEPRSRRALWLICALLALFSLIGVGKRAARGDQAILRWRPDFALMDAAQSPYAVAVEGAAAGEEGEGYPTPPLSAVLMDGLLRLGDVPGSVAFGALKVLCAAWILVGAARLARFAGLLFPSWAEWMLVLLSMRVLLSDLSHGNTNLLVGAAVVGAAVAWAERRDLLAGLLVALGAALKVTPALLILILLRRPTRRAVGGLALGGLVWPLLVPGLRYGLATNLGWLADFAEQMLAPYLSGRPPGPMHAEQINQSLLGVLSRLFTDLPSIHAREGTWPTDVHLTWIALDASTFRALHRATLALVISPFLVMLWRRPERSLAGAHFAAAALIMLLASERSWKHHHVTAPLALAWCLGVVATVRSPRERGVAIGALTTALAGQSLSGSGVLGDRGSDLAEAWGAFFWADLALLAGVVCTAFRRRTTPSGPLAISGGSVDGR
jgi:hypothetical protein